MKRLFEYYLQNIRHKGKRHIVRLALFFLPFRYLKSHYGPIMRVNRRDRTNIFALSGEYGNVVSGHVKKIRQGEVFIDIGTNYGLFSLMAAELVGEQGNVFSFEPNPVIYSYFLDNIRKNGHKNIIPFHCAIADQDKLIDLTFKEEHSGASHLSENGDFTIPAFNPARWQFLTDKIGSRNVHIKIDVEGYEAIILRTISQASWFLNIKSIVVEIDDKNLQQFSCNARDDVYTPLGSHGFKPTILAKAGSHYDEIFIR